MAKASFEESLENFLKAGVNGEKESADGVSASIMLGKMPNIGTGVFDMMVDMQKLMTLGKKPKATVKVDVVETCVTKEVIQPTAPRPKFVKNLMF
jgi:DNA-directed RNA polymerase beta' subunit